MGMRFRRSKKVGPFRINVSKSGVGWSVGGKAVRYTQKSNGGTRVTVNTPVKGVYATKDFSAKQAQRQAAPQPQPSKSDKPGCLSWIALTVLAAVVIGLLKDFFSTGPVAFLILAIVGGLVAYLAYKVRKENKEEQARLEKEAEKKRIEEERQRQLEEERRAEEQRRIEEERAEKERLRKEAYEKRQKELNDAYNQMLSQIKDVPVSVSDVPAEKLDAALANEIDTSNFTVKSSRAKLGDFVVIDTETTGLSAYRDEIVEITAVRFRDFTPVEKMSSLCSTEKPIPEEATKINGITNEMVQNAPQFGQVAASLISFIGKDNLVGHYLPFDLKFIVAGGADPTGEKRKYYDTLELSRMKCREKGSGFKLKDMCLWFGIYMPNAHRAEADAIATGEVFKCLVDMVLPD